MLRPRRRNGIDVESVDVMAIDLAILPRRNKHRHKHNEDTTKGKSTLDTGSDENKQKRETGKNVEKELI